MKKLWFILVSTICGLYGGQKNKGVRRFGIPALAVTASLKNFSLKNLALLLLIPTLVMGYGENSWLHRFVGGNETLTRLLYATFLSLPFIFWGMRFWFLSVIFLVGAFQVRAGSLGFISFFGDILIEDIFRYLTLSVVISLAIFRKK